MSTNASTVPSNWPAQATKKEQLGVVCKMGGGGGGWLSMRGQVDMGNELCEKVGHMVNFGNRVLSGLYEVFRE